ncbi:MAG: hypothetical protein HQK82_01085 [Desulfovibrionaceae bacterium]|nr:hypothetical protein [Desulfovibrionaceae bacterium]
MKIVERWRETYPPTRGLGMLFVNVLKGPKPGKDNSDIAPSIFKHVDNILISLKSAYGEKLSDKSMGTFCNDLKDFHEKYDNFQKKIWIDSGGYHFITGTYGTDDIEKIIKKYHHFLIEYRDSFDFIFSLDFPFNKKEPSFSKNKKGLYDANKSSLKMSIDAIGKHTELSDKYYFVVQFLKDKQYDVWRKLYKDLDLGRVIKNRAIGGLVGVRKVKRSVPSPFIPVAYRCLVDFINAQEFQNSKTFKLHFLGVYLLQDRFEILLLESLFKTYLPGIEVFFTYDSSAYVKKAMKGHLTLPAFMPNNSFGYKYIQRFDDINVNTDVEISDGDEFLDLNKIYDDKVLHLARSVLEMSFEKRNKKLKKDLVGKIDKENGKKSIADESGRIDIFQPLNILSNKCQDEILKASIERRSLADQIVKLSDNEHCKECATNYIFELAHLDENERDICGDNVKLSESDLFSDLNLLWSIRRNIILTYKCHQYFLKNSDDEDRLDNMLNSFIDDFNSDTKEW